MPDPFEGSAAELAAWEKMRTAVLRAQGNPSEINLAIVRRNRDALVDAMTEPAPARRRPAA